MMILPALTMFCGFAAAVDEAGWMMSLPPCLPCRFKMYKGGGDNAWIKAFPYAHICNLIYSSTQETLHMTIKTPPKLHFLRFCQNLKITTLLAQFFFF